jgi:lipopolysaccharide export system protein LptA
MIRRRAVLTLALSLAAGAAIAAPQAPAQPQPAPAAAKHDSNAPLDWVANSIEVQDRAHRATLVGNVRVVQQEMTLTADRVTADYTGSIANSGGAGGGNPQVQRLDATGNVVVTRPSEIARGDYGIYDLEKKLITMIGHVTLDRNGSVVRGGRLVIDQNTNRATVDGSAVGGAGSAGVGGRVSGRFNVATNDKSPAAGGAKPAKKAKGAKKKP